MQVLLRQEHHDEGARQTVRVQVRLPWADDRVPPKPTANAAAAAVVRGRSAPAAAVVRFAVHVRVRVRRSVRPAARGPVKLVVVGGRDIPARAVLLVDVRAARAVPASGRRSAVSAVILQLLLLVLVRNHRAT